MWMPKIFWRMFKNTGRSMSSMNINAFQRIAGEQCSQKVHVQSRTLHIDLSYFKWAVGSQNDSYSTTKRAISCCTLIMSCVCGMHLDSTDHICIYSIPACFHREPLSAEFLLTAVQIYLLLLRYPQNEFRMLLKQLQAFGVKTHV